MNKLMKYFVLPASCLALLIATNQTSHAASQTSINEVQKAFIAFYGRPAAPAGLMWWADNYEKTGSWDALIESFSNTP